MNHSTKIFRTQKNTVFILLLLVPLLLLPLACSSAPKKSEPETPTASQAAKYAEFGNSFFNESRFTQAADMYLLALDRYIRIDNQFGVVSSYNSLGKTYLALGEIQKAETILQSALKILESLDVADNKNDELRSLASETYNNYGELIYAAGDYSGSQVWFERGLAEVEDDVNRKAYAILLHNRGTVRFKLGEYEKAKEDISKALKINKDLGYFYEIASNHYMLAVLSIKEQMLDEAYRNASIALDYDREMENSTGIAHDLFLLGRLEIMRGNREKGISYLERSYRIFESLNLEAERQMVLEYRNNITAS